MIYLNRSYGGYPAQTIAQFQTAEEAALIAQNIGSASVGPVTPGNVSTIKLMGRVGIAAGASTVTISNPSFTTESKFTAYLSNATVDGTATFVARITPAAGSVTIAVNANTTAAVAIDWYWVNLSGDLPTA